MVRGARERSGGKNSNKATKITEDTENKGRGVAIFVLSGLSVLRGYSVTAAIEFSIVTNITYVGVIFSIDCGDNDYPEPNNHAMH